MGFYLTNIAFVLLTLRSGLRPLTALQAVELLSSKIGLILCVLGVMHLFNLLVFSSLRRKIPSTGPPSPPIPRRSDSPLLRKRAVKMDKDTKGSDQKLDQRKVIALAEYVQKLGSVERAKKALDALEQLRRAA